jgi:hypothetical protein
VLDPREYFFYERAQRGMPHEVVPNCRAGRFGRAGWKKKQFAICSLAAHDACITGQGSYPSGVGG